MKKYLFYLAVATLVVIAAFFIYKKMYGNYNQPLREQQLVQKMPPEDAFFFQN